jgi:hypothetical protein
MTLEDVQARVAEIRSIGAGDPEAAHSKEDDLYRDVLQFIAYGPQGLHKELAYAALETQEEDFPRWCA